MRKVLLIALSLITATLIFAQSSSSKKSGVWNPWGVAEAGIVMGSYEGNSDLRLQGGVSKNNWLFGIGIANDAYRYNSMPIYLQARKSFLSGKRRPFVLVSAGYNFATEKDYTPDWFFTGVRGAVPTYQYSSGYYGELGAGYAFRAHKKWGYTLSFSYTRKTMTEKYNSTIWNGNIPENGVNQNLYKMHRFAVRMGIRIGR